MFFMYDGPNLFIVRLSSSASLPLSNSKWTASESPFILFLKPENKSTENHPNKSLLCLSTYNNIFLALKAAKMAKGNLSLPPANSPGILSTSA